MCRREYDEYGSGYELRQCLYAEEAENKLDEIKRNFSVVIAQLYSKDKMDVFNLEQAIDLIIAELNMEYPENEIQISRKNETLNNIQFILNRQAVLA